MTDNETAQPVGYWINMFRKCLGLRARAIKEKSGVSISHICNCERGCYNPRPESLKKISDAFHIPADVFMLLSQPECNKFVSTDPIAQNIVDAARDVLSCERILHARLIEASEVSK